MGQWKGLMSKCGPSKLTSAYSENKPVFVHRKVEKLEPEGPEGHPPVKNGLLAKVNL